MHTFGFILEQTLGHRTHAQNLQRVLTHNATVAAKWGLIPWESAGLANYLPIYRSNWTVRAGLRARRTIAAMNREEALDALFIHTQVPAVLAADWVRRIPTVISLDATPQQYDELGAHYAHGQQAERLEQLKWRLIRHSLAQARHLVTWSTWAKESLVNDYAIPAKQITVIPPGVNLHLWPQRPDCSYVASQEEGSPIRILFVGGDFQRKGGEQLLRVFRRIRQQLGKRQKVELHLVTRQPLAPEAALTVYTDMEPNSDRLRTLFQQCDIFCLPTTGDCLPMVLAEAGATGLPLIATNVGAVREIVRDGETGILVMPEDERGLEQALLQLIHDGTLRRTLGSNAADLIRRAHDVERNTNELLALLEVSSVGKRNAL